MATKTSPAPSPTPSPAVQTKTKVKVEATVNSTLVTYFQTYYENVAKSESSLITLAEYVQKNSLDRATVVISLMKARNITYETAAQQYSKLKRILNNEEVLKGLKDGKLTMKEAQSAVTTKQKNPASASQESKEAKYNNTLKAFATAAKETGHNLKEIMVGVEAELKSAGIK